jgi:hypothetical protein
MSLLDLMQQMGSRSITVPVETEVAVVSESLMSLGIVFPVQVTDDPALQNATITAQTLPRTADGRLMNLASDGILPTSYQINGPEGYECGEVIKQWGGNSQWLQDWNARVKAKLGNDFDTTGMPLMQAQIVMFAYYSTLQAERLAAQQGE